jgi:hypothetical protein
MWKEKMEMLNVRRTVFTAGALLALLAAVPQGAAAKSLVPFHATTRETVAVVPCDPNFLCISITGSGHATQLGKISESAHYAIDLVNVPTPGCNTNSGTMTLTGGNGDSIRLALHGTGCNASPTTQTIVNSYVVTGGTGRFSGATGSGTETVHSEVTNPAAPTGVARFEGTLSSPRPHCESASHAGDDDEASERCLHRVG